MTKLKTHLPAAPTAIKHSALYKKGVGIYELSRKLNENKHLRELSSQPVQNHSRLEEVILLAIRLPYTIALAQVAPNYHTKLRSSNTILRSIALLKMHCSALKEITHSTQDLARMNKELSKFSRMHQNWRLILTQQN